MTSRIKLLLCVLFGFAIPANADITTGLVAHWVCDDNAASTTVTATVGPNGTLVGGDNTSAIFVGAGNGPNGGNAGFTFDGSNDYFTFDDPAVDLENPVTLACWVKTTTTTADTKIVGGHGPSPFNGYAMGVNVAGNANKFTAYGQGAWIPSTTSINTGVWVHCAFTKAASGTPNLRVYVNGVQENTGNESAIVLYTGSRSVGADADGSSKLTGSVADVRIYSRALSASDIVELTNVVPGASGPAINPISSSIPGSSLDPIRTTIP